MIKDSQNLSFIKCNLIIFSHDARSLHVLKEGLIGIIDDIENNTDGIIGPFIFSKNTGVELPQPLTSRYTITANTKGIFNSGFHTYLEVFTFKNF